MPTRLLILTLATATTAIAATAQRPSAPVLTVQRVETVTVAGKITEKLTTAKEAVPGATYQVNIASVMPEGLKDRQGKPVNASLTFPIPAQATYIDGSARSERDNVAVVFALKYPAKASDFSAKPTKTVTVRENGVDVKRTVTASPNEYRAVKFIYGTQTGNFNSSLRYRVN